MHLFFLLCSLFSLLFSSLQAAENDTSSKLRILVGSPIRQQPEILKEFLESLDNVEKKSYTFDFCFVNDNVDPVSTKILQDFSEAHSGHCILLSPEVPSQNSIYFKNEQTHFWTNDLIWKVAAFKDRIIEYAKEKKYDYLFLIDSDLVLHPKTIEQLLSAKKGVICNIFWTSWQPGTIEMPQVWMQDEYNFYEITNNQKPSPEEMVKQQFEFMALLRVPGVYEVGGMGACTLIDRASLNKGVAFKKIKNLSFWGEDRHFCIRAAALDIPLYVDTHYPAYHIYRTTALDGVAAFKEASKPSVSEESSKKIRLTLSMIVKNEADRYLKSVLEAVKPYITDAVIIDDGSNDGSPQICKEVLAGIPLKLIINDHSKFSKECSLREQQWNETVATNPEWILCLDADEIFEGRFKDVVGQMIADPSVDSYLFRLYDFWTPTKYRDDAYWQAHLFYRPFLVRYIPTMTYTFKQSAQHCGRFPVEINHYSKAVCSDLRLKHYGWSNPQDRINKYKRYQELDPGAKYGWKEQYESILDPNPHLVEWKE